MIPFQRILKFQITKRIIDSYGKLVNKKFQLADHISGSQGWCDFFNQNEWGECTNTFQNPQEAEYIHKNLFKLDIEAIEKEYQIKVDKKTIPNQKQNIFREYSVNTNDRIIKRLEDKLNKKYSYEKYGFINKGILIVGIFDPSFSGFINDIELNKSVLDKLQKEMQTKCINSSFRKVLLVDALAPFENNLQNHVYEFFYFID